MRNSAKVAVVVPAYNAEKTIRRALDSIAAQTVLPSRIIVVDDCSKDQTIAKISEFIQENNTVPVTLIKNASNIGPGYSRNLGWDAADSEYVAFLDSDDAWIPKKIEIQLQVLEDDPEIDLLCSETQLAGSFLINKQNHKLDKLRSITFAQMLFKNQIPTRTVVMKRSIPYRFEEGLSEDYGLWLNCLRNGLIIKKIPIPLALHFRPEFSPGGLSAKLLLHEFYEIRILLNQIGHKPFVVFCAIIFSLVKFLRRILIKFVRKVRN
jgi:glycosyltransferase involved in cell wall biosynthesis